MLSTGAPWVDLPDRYPSHQTCHRRFQQWVRCGVLKDVLDVLTQALHDEGYLDLREAFIDGSFAPAKKGGACVGKTKRGKGSKIMAIPDRHGCPVAVHMTSATPHEVTLVDATLAESFVNEPPEHLIGDLSGSLAHGGKQSTFGSGLIPCYRAISLERNEHLRWKTASLKAHPHEFLHKRLYETSRGMSRALLKLSGGSVHDYATISDDSPSPSRASRARRAATSAG